MTKLLTTLVVILTIVQAIKCEHHDDHSQHNHKKDHQVGFFVSFLNFSVRVQDFSFENLRSHIFLVTSKGSRGKRSISSDSASVNDINDISDANLKELNGLRDSLMGMQRDARAPKGFFGMRGKKDYDYQIQQKRALLGLQQVCWVSDF